MLSPIFIQRNLVHLVIGVFVAFGIFTGVLSETILAIVMVVSLVIYGLNKKKPISCLQPILCSMESKENMKKQPGIGAVYLIAGSFISSLLFSRDIASAAVIILALGDSIAPLVGQYGRVKHPFARDPSKLLEGGIGGTVAAFLGTLFFVHPLVGAVGAVFGMILEAVEVRVGREIDDNLVIPLAAGIAMTVTAYFLGI